MTTLVLLPGLDGTGRLFDSLIQALGRDVGTQVIAYPPDPTLGYAELLTWTRTQLPAHQPLVLLGESFSGPLAIRLAVERPEQVRGVILCCTFASNPRPWLRWTGFALGAIPFQWLPTSPLSCLLQGSGVPQSAHELSLNVLRTLSPELIRARLREVMTVDVQEELRQIAVPILYLQAENDHLVPHAAGEAIRAHGRDVELVRLAGPHGLLQVRAHAAADRVKNYIQRVQHPTDPNTGISTPGRQKHASQ